MILLAIPLAIFFCVLIAGKQHKIRNDHTYHGGPTRWYLDPYGRWHCLEARRPAFVGEYSEPEWVEVYPDDEYGSKW